MILGFIILSFAILSFIMLYFIIPGFYLYYILNFRIILIELSNNKFRLKPVEENK